MRVERFEIEIQEGALKDLKDRLNRTRWPDELEGVNWEYGTSLQAVKNLASYWESDFNWREQERQLNTFPHFIADVDDQRIHFIHARGTGPSPLPLIISHGWPGSFAEMVKIIPLLTDPARYGGDPMDAFDVVVPSLPGYGFSDHPTKRGISPFRIAELWKQLMHGLGYERFAAQGGDFGASVSTCLGYSFPNNIIGVHLNFIPGSFKPPLDDAERPLSEAERIYVATHAAWVSDEGGYGHIQATKPQTLTYGLNDSPAGLAAWMIEKFRSWSDCNGDIETVFSRDELLTNISIYWFTETIGSSMRLYAETRQRPLSFTRGERVTG